MNLEKYNLLIVDDEPKVLELLKKALMSSRYNIFTSLCGKEALEFMEQSPEMAVVVSNYHMGVMNGADFCREVKIQSPNTIRIMMTAGLAEDKLHAMKDGELIHTFSLKPIILENFIIQVNHGIEMYIENKNSD
jgi:response regulator RpfG family c-di-GMP phosphodiesterase